MKYSLDDLNTPASDSKIIKPALEEEISAKHIIVPLQNEFAFASADSQHPYIGTTGLATCTAVTFYDPLTKTAAIAHLDTKSDVSSLYDIIKRFPSGNTLEVAVNGGNTDPESIKKSQDIFDLLSNQPNISITAIHVNAEQHPRMLVMDTKTGYLHEQEPSHDLEAGMARAYLTSLSKALSSLKSRPLVEIIQERGETMPLSHVVLSHKFITFLDELKDKPTGHIIQSLQKIWPDVPVPEIALTVVRDFDTAAAFKALKQFETRDTTPRISPVKEKQETSLPEPSHSSKEHILYRRDLVLDIVKGFTGKKKNPSFSLSHGLEHMLRDITRESKHNPAQYLKESEFEALFDAANKGSKNTLSFEQAKESYRTLIELEKVHGKVKH